MFTQRTEKALSSQAMTPLLPNNEVITDLHSLGDDITAPAGRTFRATVWS